MTSVDTCVGVAPRRWPPLAGALAAATCLAGCGGASGTDEPSAASTPSSHWSAPLSQREAVRLANQATFGASEALLAGMRAQGARHWVDFQLTLGTSRYTRGEGDAIHRHPGPDAYCDSRGPACRRDAESTAPLLADFYANALEQPDQLRQRVAFALQQIVVLSGRELRGTYGFRHFYNGLLDRAFGNYREVLKLAALSPLMGDYLTFVNNGPEAPNENFGRELIQLFSLGTCLLEPDGSLRTGHCLPTYTNEMVRSVAHALTGWTYPAGGARHPGCAPAGLNCTYYQGEMVQAPGFHDTREHALPGGRSIPAGATGEEALEAVLDSLMAHPNMGPFIGRRLIQHLVTSNPTPAYVRRVAQAFESGRHEAVGTGVRGDLAATVHALLLDPEARAEPDPARAGKLREPALMFTGVLRGLDGRSDGAGLGPERGEALRQHVFRPTSVFGYYRPGYPVPGTTLEGPEFGIHGEGAAVERLDFLSALLGDDPTASAATAVDLTGFLDTASDPAALVDRIARLAIGAPLPEGPREHVIAAVSAHEPTDASPTWRRARVQTAAYLVYAAPQYQVHP
ncbi:MAG: DUF1800 domain-containing protein [Pseudomonadota bacterium]|nr:DUF1800 domain-containing protein [Pseudomonadota bacterium]